MVKGFKGSSPKSSIWSGYGLYFMFVEWNTKVCVVIVKVSQQGSYIIRNKINERKKHKNTYKAKKMT